MMEKLAQAGEGGGNPPTPFQPITIKYNVAVYAPAERADTLPVFHLYTLKVLFGIPHQKLPCNILKVNILHFSQWF